MENSPQKELLDAIDIIAKGYDKKTTQIYNGLVVQAVTSIIYEIKVNGQNYKLPKYGSNTPIVNSNVKVFVPKNNWAQAFFIVGGEGSSPTETDYNSLSNKPSINNITLSGNKTSSELNLYGTGNEPPYPVTSVNTKTGAVSLTTDNIPATANNRYVPAVPATNPNTTFLNGNGVFTAIASGGATSMGNMFMSNTPSTVSGYKTLSYASDSTATEMSVTCTSASDVLSAVYLYSAPLGTNVIDAGIWKSTIYAKTSVQNGINRLKFVCFVRHIDGTETDLFTGHSASVAQTTYGYFYTETNRQQFNVLDTDTFGIRIYGNTDRTSPATIYYQIGGIDGSYINTPLALRHTQLRDLNGDPSYQHIPVSLVNQITTNKQNIDILNTDVSNLQSGLSAEITNRQNADISLQNQINTKLETNGDGSNVTSTFSTTETFTNITSGSKLSLLFGKVYTAIGNLISHINNTLNPHNVTKAQVGLSNVANTLQYSASNPPPYPVISVDGQTGTVVLNDVKYTAQTLTNGQKTQARANINAGTSNFSGSYTDLSNKPTIPTKTSELTNDSNYLPVTQTTPTNGQIVSYDGTKWVNSNPQTFSQQQSNWNESNTSSVQYIQNKPTALSAFTNDTNYITSAGAPVQSVNGQTGDVVVSAGNATYLSSTQPVSAKSGDIWYKIL